MSRHTCPCTFTSEIKYDADVSVVSYWGLFLFVSLVMCPLIMQYGECLNMKMCGAFHRLKFVNQYFSDNLLSEDVLKLLEYVLNTRANMLNMSDKLDVFNQGCFSFCCFIP